ncbi:MAG: response regulator [Desulfotalea sp.]
MAGHNIAKKLSFTNQTVLQYIQNTDVLQKSKDISLKITCGQQIGYIHIFNKKIHASQCGRLKGNGAVMVMAGWMNAEVNELAFAGPSKKNISLSLDGIISVKNHYGAITSDLQQDDKLLRQAIVLIYSLQYQKAGSVLTKLLRANRYDYTAWLWYSRLLVKIKDIESALDQAQEWGNTDQDVWGELKNIQFLVGTDCTSVRRCHFCWSPIKDKASHCHSCNVQLSITEDHKQSKINSENLKKVIIRFRKTADAFPGKASIAYIVSLGLYNLSQYKQALVYLKKAVSYSPDTHLYRQACLNLEKIIRKIVPKSSTKIDIPKEKKKNIVKSVGKASSARKKVLVVEDSPTSQKVISMILTRAGIQTISAVTGTDAIFLSKEHTPDLILLDVMLPDMTGYDVLQHIRGQEELKNVPVIMLTGKTGAQDRLKGLQAGSSEYLTKPFDPQKLTKIINQYLK